MTPSSPMKTELAELRKQMELLTHAIMVKQDTVPQTISELIRDQTKKFEVVHKTLVDYAQAQELAHQHLDARMDEMEQSLKPISDAWNGSKWIAWFVVIVAGIIGTVVALKTQVHSLIYG